MRTAFAFVALLAATGLTAAQEGKPFESKEGRFAVRFPGDTRAEVKTVVQKAGGLELTLSVVEKGGAGHVVAFADVGPEATKLPPAQVLERAEQGLVSIFKAKVTKAGASTFKASGKDHAARDVIAEKDAATIRMKLILIDGRLYELFVVGPKEATTGKDADEFLNSFTVTK